jgi:hypothetical protein
VAIKRKKLVGIITLAVIALALAVALVLSSRYMATTVILPPQQSSSAGAAMMAQLNSLSTMAGAGALGIKNPNDLQVALLKSRSVEDAMAARFHLQALYHAKYLSSARKRWEKKTFIDDGLKDGLIRLSVTDSDPQSWPTAGWRNTSASRRRWRWATRPGEDSSSSGKWLTRARIWRAPKRR